MLNRLVRKQINQLWMKSGVIEDENDQRHGQAEAVRTAAAGIDIENFVPNLDQRLMRMAADDCGDTSNPGIQIEIVNGVNEVEEVASEFNGLRSRESRAGTACIDISADGSRWGDGAERVENGWVADISGVQDVIDMSERAGDLGAQQAVRI